MSNFPDNPLNPDNKPILCLDFDGVIHTYTSRWTFPEEIRDEVTDGFWEWAIEASKLFHLVLYSSRSSSREARIAMSQWMLEKMTAWWGDREGEKPVLTIEYMSEKPPAFLTIDDRALTFTGNWDLFDPQTLINFKPWNRY